MNDKNLEGQGNEEIKKLEEDLKALGEEAKKEIDRQKSQKEATNNLQAEEIKAQNSIEQASMASQQDSTESFEHLEQTQKVKDEFPKATPEPSKETPETPVFQEPEPERKVEGSGKGKMLLWIFLAIFIAFLLVAGGYYLGTKSAKPQSTPTSQPTVIPIVPTPTPDTTLNWKTYSDLVLNYSFKYPSDLNPYVDETYKIVYFSTSSEPNTKNSDFYIRVIKEEEGVYATFSNREQKGDAQIDQLSTYIDVLGRKWVINGPTWGQADTSNYEAEIKINSIYYVVSSQFFGRNLEEHLGKTMIIKEDNMFDATPLLQEQKEIMQKILSTFKFLESSPSASPTATSSSSAIPTPTVY